MQTLVPVRAGAHHSPPLYSLDSCHESAERASVGAREGRRSSDRFGLQSNNFNGAGNLSNTHLQVPRAACCFRLVQRASRLQFCCASRASGPQVRARPPAAVEAARSGCGVSAPVQVHGCMCSRVFRSLDACVQREGGVVRTALICMVCTSLGKARLRRHLPCPRSPV